MAPVVVRRRWTCVRKVCALSAEQFQWLKTAIANQRHVWDTLMKMQQLTAEHVFKNLPNPTRRKRLTKKRLGLN